MEEARKQEVLSRISAWLDDWPDQEPLPEGLDPAVVDSDEAPDLAQLTAAVIGSSKEMQIQGRAFKRLEERLADLPALAAIDERLVGIESALDASRESANGVALEEILELHDRLARCVVGGRAAAGRLSWLARRGGARPLVQGVVDGISLCLDRLTESLARAGVRAVETDGRAFDPKTMRAIDRVPADDRHAPGTVADTVCRGYVEGDRVLRVADVRVAVASTEVKT